MGKDETISDRMMKVCLCKGVTKYTIKECIKEGARTVDDVRKNTGASGGACKGRRCLDKINEIINEYDKGEN